MLKLIAQLGMQRTSQHACTQVDFLKVLPILFLVPVIGPSAMTSRSLALFSAENIKNLPLVLRAREKILSSTCRQV